MTFFLNVSERFLFVADLSEQSSADRSKEQLPSPSGTKFIAPVHTNPVSHERYYNVYKGFNFIVCHLIVTLILITTFRPHTAGLHQAIVLIY